MPGRSQIRTGEYPTAPGLTNPKAQYNFLSLRAQLEPLGQEVQEITRPGVDGLAFRLLGKRSHPLEVITIEPFDREDRFYARLQIYNDVRGQLVDVFDDFAVPFLALAVLNVERVETRRLLASVGGAVANPRMLIGMKWTMSTTK